MKQIYNFEHETHCIPEVLLNFSEYGKSWFGQNKNQNIFVLLGLAKQNKDFLVLRTKLTEILK